VILGSMSWHCPMQFYQRRQCRSPDSAAQTMVQFISGEKTPGVFKDDAARARAVGGSVVDRLTMATQKDKKSAR
jgi:hypothetical protein